MVCSLPQISILWSSQMPCFGNVLLKALLYRSIMTWINQWMCPWTLMAPLTHSSHTIRLDEWVCPTRWKGEPLSHQGMSQRDMMFMDGWRVPTPPSMHMDYNMRWRMTCIDAGFFVDWEAFKGFMDLSLKSLREKKISF